MVTCFFNFLHHSDWNVRQSPSSASTLEKSENSHNKSQKTILLVVTPAFLAMQSNPKQSEKVIFFKQHNMVGTVADPTLMLVGAASSRDCTASL